MSKRKHQELDEEIFARKAIRKTENVKKHSLDSDEEDDDDDEKNNVLHEDDIEGEEEATEENNDGVPLTAFNMREELEEGHFDKQGNFIWSNEKEIRDNWLDNINWQQIKSVKKKNVAKGLGDESDSEEEPFDEIKTYRELLKYMKPNENINKTIRRLGGNNKLTSAERLKRKKAGTLDSTSDSDVAKVTELANKILTEIGNMDVYQETYQQISDKIQKHDQKVKSRDGGLDMYSDDFEVKEKEKLEDAGPSHQKPSDNPSMWEFKWQEDSSEIQGPFSSSQMLSWTNEGYFGKGVLVRKCGETSNFYTSSRIDFDLYL